MFRTRFSARDDRGAVIALVAMMLVMLMVFAAFAIDLGNHRQSKNKADSAADAAALAGAQGLVSTKSAKPISTALSSAVNKQGIADAAANAFNNLDLDVTTITPTKCNVYSDPNTVTWCYNAGDAKNTVVQVSSPYVTTKTQSDGSAYKKNELLHVDVCFDVNYSIASVIGVNKARTCGRATGRGSLGTGQNTEPEDEVGDPLTVCNGLPDVITTPYFPAKDTDAAADKDLGATYLDNSDIDMSSLQYYLDGTLVPAAQYKVTAKTPPSGYAFKYEVKYRTPRSGPLGNGQHTVYMIVRNQAGTGCSTKAWTFWVGPVGNLGNTECQEDLFRGTESPADGATISPGQYLQVDYWDETPINGYTISGSTGTLDTTSEFRPIFNIDPPTMSNGKLGDPTKNVPYTITFETTNGKGERKYHSKIAFQLTDIVNGVNLTNGNHTIYVQAWDSDQNKAGGDCGVAKWTINFTGLKTKTIIELVE